MKRRDFVKRLATGIGSVSVFGRRAAAAGKGGTLLVVGGSHPPAQLVVGSQPSEIVTHAATAVQQVIQQRTGNTLPIRSDYEANGAMIILLGTLDRNAALNKVLSRLARRPVMADDPGREGFRLLSVGRDGLAAAVVNGCDDLGTFHGAGWLLRKMNFTEGETTISAGLKISTAPATAMRRIRFGDHYGYVNTELSGWKDIWTDYIFWGLSAATMRCDPAHQGDPRETEMAKYLWHKWAERVPLAKSMGLEVVHLTQTNLVFKDGEFGPTGIPNFKELNYMCPDFNGVDPKFPRALEVLKESRKWFFDHMPHIKDVDYFLTSGWDGGGCKDPAVAPWAVTYANLVDKLVYPLIAEHNPRAKVIFGLYGMEAENAGGIPELANKLREGWKPNWLYALELDQNEIDDAPRFPESIPRLLMCLWGTSLSYVAFPYTQMVGANPVPVYSEQTFRKAWDQGIRGGTGCYSEGVHDFVNQQMMIQLAWDPARSGNEILEEICRYYFGDKASTAVRKAFLLMEQEKTRRITDPLTDQDQQIQVLVSEAERAMPQWARSSRQWALVAGRANVDRTISREGQLLNEFDNHWSRYKSLRARQIVPGKPDWLQETQTYFQAVVDNAYKIIATYKNLNRHGYGVLGGGQYSWWPDPRTAQAVDALTALQHWEDSTYWQAPTRPAIAFLDQEGRVSVTDAWSNYLQLEKPRAADTRLMIADVRGDEAKQIIFLGDDGKLHSWSLLSKASAPFAEGHFLTGPLAAGHFSATQNDAVLVLEGTSLEDARLAMVDGKGGIRTLKICPAGPAPGEASTGVVLGDVRPQRTVRIDFDPQVQICDLDGDGTLEIVCTDRAQGRLVGLDPVGKQKLLGPEAPAGALAQGDLNGDGRPEIAFLDAANRLCVFSGGGQVLYFAETVRPPALAVAVVNFDRASKSQVVYVDADRHLRVVELGSQERLLTDLTNSVAMAPALQVGPFGRGGGGEVCYLRRRLCFRYPLADLSLIDANGDHRDLPLPSTLNAISAVSPLLVTAPLGPRASGMLTFPFE